MNMPRPNDPMSLDLTAAECIASCSTESDGRARWTVLSVFRLDDKYVSQVEACSSLPGERTKTRRIAATSLERALKLFDESDLGRVVIETAREWDESHRRRQALAGNKQWTDEEALERLYGQPTGRKGYSGLVAEDFGVGESTVRAAIKNGTGIKVPLAAILPFLDLERLEAAREARNG